MTPPALFASGPANLDFCVLRAPFGAERVELADAGRVLRGVFVPADADAPVVMHLLGSGQSVAATRLGLRSLFARFRHLGCASLALDYGGVGVSDGERDVRRLREDALAMWREALRRAGGDERRIVLRCTSIGGIAAADLLAAGARPRAVVWIAPVSPRTAVHQAVARNAGSFAATLVSWMFAPISEVDPIEALARVSPAALLVTSEHDSFLDSEYHERLREFASASGCTFVEEFHSEHEWLAMGSLELGAREALWLVERGVVSSSVAARPSRLPAVISSDAAARERFEKLARLAPNLAPEELAAAALIDDLEFAALLVWLRIAHGTPPARFEDLRRVYDAARRPGAPGYAQLNGHHVIVGEPKLEDLQRAVAVVLAWDGSSSLLLRWRHDGFTVIETVSNVGELERHFGLPKELRSRRAWLIEAFARGAGWLVTSQTGADGRVEIRCLDENGAWVELDGAGMRDAVHDGP